MEQEDIQKKLGEEYEQVVQTVENQLKFEHVDQAFEGEFVKAEKGVYGDNYTLKDKDGKEWFLFGSSVLWTAFRDMKEGDKIKIVYLGVRKSSTGRLYADYAVGKKKK